MRFIGQEGILKELQYIIPEFEIGNNMNILFAAPSGFGKTTLALLIVGKLKQEENTVLYIPDNDGHIFLDLERRFQIIDEAQTLKNPEILYPYMDKKDNSFFILTNELGLLKEPLINRCIPFYFQPYTNEDILEIVMDTLITYEIDENLGEIIVQNCKNNPRVAIKLCERLENIFKHKGIPKTREDIEFILQDILGIYNGLNQMDFIYLRFLNSVEKAGLDAISNYTRLDKNTIRKEIEPFLLENGIIEITSRGRILRKKINVN